MVRGALALAVIACLLVSPSAHAAGHALTLSDPRETSCSGPACTPDISSLAIYYDSDGTFLVATTFYEALPAYNATTAARVRVNLGRRLTADGSACAPVGPAGQLTGEAGDVRVEIGAYDGGSSPSTAANGVLYRAGSAFSLATTRTISSDRKTLTVSADSPALAGLDLRCTQADLADDSGAGTVVRDAVQLAWFPEFAPEPAVATGTAAPSDEAGSGATAASGPAQQLRPALVRAPALRGTGKVAALLTCSTGRWKQATRFSYRWFRAGHRIAKASSRRYRARPADSGQLVRCNVTATNANGSTVAASRTLRIR